MSRTILHSDCNCFYASVELLHHPELRGKPVAVGGDPEARHGIVLTADYIAKRHGVKTGMALWQVKQVCPDITFLPPKMDLYLRFSKMTHEIYAEYTDRQEPYGIDECWLDVTDSIGIKGDGYQVAREISGRIKSELGITVSIGVSFNKIFAKLGSDYKKPDAIRKYFDPIYYTQGEKRVCQCARERTEIIDREIQLCGYFVLVTSEKMTAADALAIYKSRDGSEKLFSGDKSYLGNRSCRVHSTESVENKIFIEFVAPVIRNRFFTYLKDYIRRSEKKENFLTVPAAIRELEKIEMVRLSDGNYRMDHA